MIIQVQIEARMRQGQVLTFLKGTGKPDEAMLAANDNTAALFREVVGDVERNYATQASPFLLPWTIQTCMATPHSPLATPPLSCLNPEQVFVLVLSN